mgnify:CR=1 FL=1
MKRRSVCPRQTSGRPTGPSESARCPDLKGIGSKLSKDFLYESLTDPQAFVYQDYRHGGIPKEYPARMPHINKNPIGLSKNEILSVIAFLLHFA